MKEIDLKRRLIDLEYQSESIAARIRDIEWLIENDEERTDSSLDDRRKAIDKLKYIRGEIAETKMALLEVK